MNKITAITFPATAGLHAVGPFLTGKTYLVPDDVGTHLLARGAVKVDPATIKDVAKDTQPLEGNHHDHFKTVRDFVEAEKVAAAKAKADADQAAAEKAAAAKSGDAGVATEKSAAQNAS
jgi:hypothetical protein